MQLAQVAPAHCQRKFLLLQARDLHERARFVDDFLLSLGNPTVENVKSLVKDRLDASDLALCNGKYVKKDTLPITLEILSPKSPYPFKFAL